MADVRALVEEVAKSLVDAPEQVEVREQNGVVSLQVAPGDLGKVIGRQGRTARSLRTLLAVAGMKTNRRVSLDIVE